MKEERRGGKKNSLSHDERETRRCLPESSASCIPHHHHDAGREMPLSFFSYDCANNLEAHTQQQHTCTHTGAQAAAAARMHIFSLGLFLQKPFYSIKHFIGMRVCGRLTGSKTFCEDEEMTDCTVVKGEKGESRRKSAPL